MATITQDMKYKQSLMKYADVHGVSKASRKYNRARSYVYFWLKRWDGSVESLRPESRRPHHHPNQHTPAELKLIHDMRRRNPKLGMVEFWCKLRARGYSRCIESLWRVLKREGLIAVKEKDPYKPKPYQQMTHCKVYTYERFPDQSLIHFLCRNSRNRKEKRSYLAALRKLKRGFVLRDYLD